jgi:CRISPR system Cascade subunit CasB
MSTTADDSAALGSPPPPGPDSQLRTFVAGRVERLQAGYFSDRPQAAAAALARLRRAVQRSPGDDPAVWFETLEGFPDGLRGRGDAPSPFEVSAHVGLTLYATHQQSQRGRMHQVGYPLGRSIRLLVARDRAVEDSPVTRRFHALGTATDFTETAYHLRGLITQLRSEAIPLDYGQLVVDLRRLQASQSAGSVRLRWGRDFHRKPHREDGATAPDQHEAAAASR